MSGVRSRVLEGDADEEEEEEEEVRALKRGCGVRREVPGVEEEGRG